jgi:hypothetical protein
VSTLLHSVDKTNILNHRFNLGRARQMVFQYILCLRIYIFFDYSVEGGKTKYFLNGYGGETGKNGKSTFYGMQN